MSDKNLLCCKEWTANQNDEHLSIPLIAVQWTGRQLADRNYARATHTSGKMSDRRGAKVSSDEAMKAEMRQVVFMPTARLRQDWPAAQLSLPMVELCYSCPALVARLAARESDCEALVVG